MVGLNFRYGVLPNGFSMLALHLTVGLQARGEGEDASRAAIPFPGWNKALGADDIEKEAMNSKPIHIAFPTMILRPGGRKAHLKRDLWLINLIREAGSSGWGRGGNERPLSLRPEYPNSSVSLPGPGILPTSPHFTPKSSKFKPAPLR